MEQTTLRVLAYLNTYNRYDSTLSLSLSSIIAQTRKPDKIVIFDDNKNPRDLRQTEHFLYLFKLMDQKGIPWEYVWAEKKGAHFSHEKANMMGFDAAWFIDDDHVAEPTCLENLLAEMGGDASVGAVGGLILQPPAGPLPHQADNKISDMYLPNIQWFQWSGEPRGVEHIHSSFLYRCGIVHHDLRLSSVAFRGETMFTHSLFLKGYKLLVTPQAITWHFQTQGGIHAGQKADNWEHDESIFRSWLEFKRKNRPLYVLNCGLGDHFMFRQVIRPEPGALVSCCYSEVFKGCDVEVISIREASMLVDLKDYDVYAWCCARNWKGTLQEAFIRLYEHINQQR